MKAYVLITVRTGEVTAVIRQIKRVTGVLEAHITFGPYDAVAIVQADSIQQIGIVIHEEMHPIPGVLDTLTCIAID